MLKKILSSALIIGFMAPVSAIAETAEEKGYNIAYKWDRHDEGFNDSIVEATMVLENRHGETSERFMTMKALEVPGIDDGDKSLVTFSKPRDVKGTTFLSFAHILDADDQWLYLPALKRVKRISSKNKSGPFVGSEFSFEDLAAQEVKKYSHKWIGEEACGDAMCHVIEQIPQYERSGYSKTIQYMRQDNLQPQKVDYYDRKGSLLKTLVFSDYRQYNGKYWRAQLLSMSNHVTGKKTQLKFGAYKFQNGLTDSDFRKNQLKKAR